MSTSRRDFVALGSLGLLATAIPGSALQAPDSQSQTLPPGAPPAFGTSQPVGPAVSAATFAEAEKLVQIEMTPADLAQAAGNWRMQMAPVYERRVGPRKLALEPDLAPATLWDPSLPGIVTGKPAADTFMRSADPHAPLPAAEEDIAFASVAQLSRWIESRQLTSTRLTEIYIRRIERLDPQAPLCHHPHPRTRSRPGPSGRRRNRCRPLPRTASRHSMGRERPPRYRGHSHHLRRRAL